MLPYFYQPGLKKDMSSLILDEATSKHCVQVLRMRAGEQLLLTDGAGSKAICTILSPERKHCLVKIEHTETQQPRQVQLSLAIAFTKNNSRNEWFLEKATELGIGHIYPLVTARTEKEKLKAERLEQILVAAMLQSQQVYLPKLHEALPVKRFVTQPGAAGIPQKLIAHCIERSEKIPFLQSIQPGKSLVLMIGPEGDFTEEEVSLCLHHGYQAVSLGINRLRTETAALYGCVAFNALNYG